MRIFFNCTGAIFFTFFFLVSSAQNLHKPASYLRCYTVERIREIKKTMPNGETDAQFEAWISQKNKERKQLQRPAINYTIPVIFHIIHNGEAAGTTPNLSATSVQQQLLQLNKDFANASNSRYGVAAATGIRFVLAQRNPANAVLAEPGIDRINRNSKGWTDYANGWAPSYIDGSVKPNSIWDAGRYYNVWVVPSLNNTDNDLLGYATFPASSTLAGLNNIETNTTAGVVILTGTVGSAFLPNNCNNGFGLGKTLAHESGHFFGLRHIWGDADCGNDFCSDTPIHFTLNNGIPSHPKPNSCGTPDEMFENYMDYSDDILLNTFTANQVERMQTVMLNSPRRVTLATSTVGGVTATGSNRVSFINCTSALAVTETGTTAAYPRYKDISLTLNVEDKATGAATVNINATGTATATHFQLLTSSVTFAAGDNFQPVNIRVFDNATVDGDRTIILNYIIAGTGVTAGPNAQSITISLADDDNMVVGQNPINLLKENFEIPAGNLYGLPAGWILLTTSGYVNPFVTSLNGDAGGTGRCAHITNNTTTRSNIYTKGVFGAAILQSPVIDASSVLALGNLSFTYKTRGLEGNDEALLTYTSSSAPTGPFYFYGSLPGELGYGPYSSNIATLANAPIIAAPSSLANRKFNICFYWQTKALTTGANPGFNVDDVVLAATPFPVETGISNTYAFDVPAGTALNNFKSTNNRAMVAVRNASQPVNAVTARVTEAGTGSVSINTNTGNFLRTQKVFQISPATPNTTATYQATFYFTMAELAVWGTDKLNLKILKVQDGVSLGSTLNSSNAQVITPTVTEDAAAGIITYTGNFTGFSQFMLVSPLTSLPVTFINFQATARQHNIELLWGTQQEVNNRGFAVERSIDGTSFTQIGWVNGNGTTQQAGTYNFTDNFVQPDVNYYYRLRQVDVDNRQVYSTVRIARIKPWAGILVKVSPNPAKDFAYLFISGTAGKASIQLINASGQKLWQQSGINAANGNYKLPLQGLAKGVYTLMIYLPEGAVAKKIIVQ